MSQEDLQPLQLPAAPAVTDYAVGEIRARLERMLSHVNGVRSSFEGESDGYPLHQMRVWARRSRAACSVFGPLFNPSEFCAIEREIKLAAEAIGAARDIDVAIQTVTDLGANLREEERAGLTMMLSALILKRAEQCAPVMAALDRLEAFQLMDRFNAMTCASEPEECAPVEQSERRDKAGKG